MMNCLVTGANGFVGKYLISELKDKYDKIYCIGLGEETGQDFELISIDIRDEKSVDSIVRSLEPDVIFHLAAQASVPVAIGNPQDTLDTNVKGTLNFLVSLAKAKKTTRFLYVSSADVYGRQDESNYPVHEEIFPNPLNPYSASKLAAEIYCRQFALQYENLKVVIARPFNHIGTGQRDIFLVPNFVKQVLEAKKSGKAEIFVGNLSSRRDFLDVRDVVRAYSILADRGVSGEVYNICSGQDISIREILDKIIELTDAKITVTVDPARFRAADTSRLLGSSAKLQKLGWSKEIDIEDSLRRIIESLG